MADADAFGECHSISGYGRDLWYSVTATADGPVAFSDVTQSFGGAGMLTVFDQCDGAELGCTLATGPSFDVQPAPTMEWFLGFWRTLRLGGFGWTPRPISLDQIEALLAHPSARFLRGLRLDAAVPQEVLVLVADKHRTLQTLYAALHNHPIDDGGLGVLAGCTRLEHLMLFSCERVTADGMATRDTVEIWDHWPALHP